MFARVLLALVLCVGCSKPIQAPKPQPPPSVKKEEAPAPVKKAAVKAPVKLPPGIAPAVGAVATVNGKDIPAAKFNTDLSRLVGTGVRVPKDRLKHIARNILSRLIEQELRRQAIATERIVLTEPEFEEAYKKYTSRYVDSEGRFDEVQFRTTLKRNNMSLTELKAQIRRERLARKLIEKLGNVSVTDAEMRAFYDNNNSSWVEDESRDVRTILSRCPPRANAEKAAACKKRAVEIYSALNAGGDFEQIAERFGNVPPRAPMHLTRSSRDVALARAAFSLKVGEVHKPIKTRWGWFVIRLIEKNKARVRAFEEVEDDIKTRLTERKYYLEGLRTVRTLRGKATIVTRLPF
ncbi:MAG: peptidyl-prolyl cis-trans isomerase [Myxococcales bacterium]|nr:peptidyl-prolyl cis-trans isomerase [Myxococcales bacterium]